MWPTSWAPSTTCCATSAPGPSTRSTPACSTSFTRSTARLGGAQPFHVISGYRSPRTNAMLHAKSNGVATHSLHIVGKAIDIRLPGRALPDLRDAALALRRGGVGYYPKSDFVHVDTGRVRRW